jgi:hypothetical protein
VQLIGFGKLMVVVSLISEAENQEQGLLMRETKVKE